VISLHYDSVVDGRTITNNALVSLPGLTSRTRVLPTQAVSPAARGGVTRDYDSQLEDYTIIAGTSDTVIPKIRHVLETLRPGMIFF